MRHISILILAWLPVLLHGQISGTVKGYENEKLVPLPGANVFWKGTETGAVTDDEGNFQIEKDPASSTLVVSFIGYKPQEKVVISRKGTMNFNLVPEGSELNEVDVIGRVDATAVNIKAAEISYNIDDKELRKAACCNLSESFETNASVDVSFTDAVTGQKQIEMLGLAGKYALIQRENIPFARGLNASTGLTYIPGPFLQSIQLTKGLSSVLNGYESLTGQINVEFYKPETAPPLYLNVFGNQGGRMELNAISGFQVKDNLWSSVMAHASTIPFAQDGNDDAFADIPTGSQLNLTNRWHWQNTESGWEGQVGITAVHEAKEGGQIDYINEQNPASNTWGFDSEDQRIEVFGKNGYVFKNEPYRSFGFIYSLSHQNRDATFGRRQYDASQSTLYLNSIYQSIFGNTQHKYRTGISLLAEDVDEQLQFTDDELYGHSRREIVPGTYFEYTYEPDLKFTLVAGIRADYNSYFDQVYFTPRLNLRYMLSDQTTFRIGGGRGQRTPNVLAENLSLLASGRVFDFQGVEKLRPEIGWNTGASWSQEIPVGKKDLKLNVDAFYTWFDTKLVADLDYSRTNVFFLQPQGSESFSVLSQLDYEIIDRLELRVAYKYLNSIDQFIGGEDLTYLIPRHRAFFNAAYATESNWKFDATLNWFGEKRLPSSEGAPKEWQRSSFSPDFFTVNLQVNKVFKNQLELFVGVDNLFDFRQKNPIVNAENPYSPYFDSNYVWGPIFGRNIYAGLYYTLGKS